MSDIIAVTCQECGHTTQTRVPERLEPWPSQEEVDRRNIKLITEAIQFALAHRDEAQSMDLLRAIRLAVPL